MKHPNIVCCPNHHIYDASLYAECPYCRKIEAEQQSLNRLVTEPEDETEEDECTKLLHVEEIPQLRFLCGWLVCLNQAEMGQSRELYCKNCISFADGHLTVAEDDATAACRLNWDREHRCMRLLPVEGTTCTVNQQVITEKRILSPYDVISLDTVRVAFVPLNTALLGWNV